MNCAFCGDTLVKEHHPEIEIDRCDRCKALWFDPGELETYAASRGYQLNRPAHVANQSDGLHLKCPSCARETLFQVAVLEVTAWHCSECGGLALEHSWLEDLAHRAASQRKESYTWKDAVLDAPEAGVSALEVVVDLVVGVFDL